MQFLGVKRLMSVLCTRAFAHQDSYSTVQFVGSMVRWGRSGRKLMGSEGMCRLAIRGNPNGDPEGDARVDTQR